MKPLALLPFILMNCSWSHAAEGNAGLGNPEVEATVSVCAKEIAPQYQKLVDAPYSCGGVMAQPRYPLVDRSSTEYQRRFEHAVQQTYTEPRHDSKGVRGMCELMALYCIDGNPKLTPAEKEKGLEAFVEQPR